LNKSQASIKLIYFQIIIDRQLINFTKSLKFPSAGEDNIIVMAAKIDKIYLSLPISRKNKETEVVETATFTVRAARNDRQEIKELTNIYNGRLVKLDAGISITADQMGKRIAKDRGSVLVASIGDKKVGLINDVKFEAEDPYGIPTNHQELTGDDTWSTSNPKKGKIWICPWVTTQPELTAGWRGELFGQSKSLAQLLVSSVVLAARESKINVAAVVAYSRPADLYQYLSSLWGEGRFSYIMPGRMLRDETRFISTDKEGLFYMYGGNRVSILDINKYLYPTRDGRILDAVIRMHIKNGAVLDPRLIFPYGQVWDGKSVFYRTGLIYKV